MFVTILVIYWIIYSIILVYYQTNNKKILTQIPEYSEELLFAKNLSPYKAVFQKKNLLAKIANSPYKPVLEKYISLTQKYLISIFILSFIAFIAIVGNVLALIF